MGKIIELTGKKFGRLTVLKYVGVNDHNAHAWRCICECGKEKDIAGMSLRGGVTNSCGCLTSESSKVRFTKHGHSMLQTSEYNCWKGINQRCKNPKNSAYYNYGGRGIKVCERWANNFDNFLEDMGNKPNSEYSIERNDVDGDYSPENCKWATDSDQARNKRIPRTNTSGFVGVTWHKRDQLWRARITVNNKRVQLGEFLNITDAIEAREQGEIKYWKKQPS